MNMPLADIIRLTEIVLQPFAGGDGDERPLPARPTSASVKRIEGELGVRIPEQLVELASRVPAYGAWYAGLGDDTDHPFHILSLNERFHRPSPDDDLPPLPRHYVMLDHGNDGICDCWDLRLRGGPSAARIQRLECSDVAWEPGVKAFRDFHEYAASVARQAAFVKDPAARKEARRLLDKYK